jgi:hypothetical protein
MVRWPQSLNSTIIIGDGGYQRSRCLNNAATAAEWSVPVSDGIVATRTTAGGFRSGDDPIVGSPLLNIRANRLQIQFRPAPGSAIGS